MKKNIFRFTPVASSLVYAWGSNSYGEYGNDDILNKYHPYPVYYSNSISSWSNSNYFTIFIDNGFLYVMGKGSSKSGLGTSFDSFYATPTFISGFVNIWDTVSCSNNHCLAIYDSSNGYGYSWGDNNYGALGNGSASSTETYVPTYNLGSNWDKLYASHNCSYGLKKDKTLYSWGTNSYGQLGLGDFGNYYSPQQIVSLNNCVYFSCKSFHCAAIKEITPSFTFSPGALYTWGLNNAGQLGTGTTNNENSPVQVGSFTDWEMVSAGYDHTLAIRGGRLYAFGSNEYGQLGDNTTTNRLTPTQIGVDTDWEYVEASMQYSIAIKNGQLYTWGRNAFANLGNNTYTTVKVPNKISNDSNFYFISSSSDYTSFAFRTVASEPTTTTTTTPLIENNYPTVWGENKQGVFGVNTLNSLNYEIINPPVSTIANYNNIEQMSIGDGYALFAIRDTNNDIKLYESGNGWGKIRQINNDLKNCTYVATDGTVNFATFRDGLNHVAYSWGSNNYLKLGYIGPLTTETISFNDSIKNNFSGFKTSNSQPWKSISVGSTHVVGIGEDGTLYQWGIVNLPSSPKTLVTPERVSDYTDWVMACAGQYTSMALRSNGDVYVWGLIYKDLNLNDFSPEPVKVNSLYPWSKIALVKSTYLAIDSYGYLWGWGYNSSGLLGPILSGTGEDYPKKISYLPGYYDVKVGSHFAIASRTDIEVLGLNKFIYMLGSNTGCVLANLFGCKYDPNAIISALSINYNLKGLDFTKTSNINGDAIFALYKQSTTTTTTVAPSSCFSNWPYGTFYSSPFGKIVGLTSGTVWGASFGPLNLLNFKLDNDPSTQTKSFFYKKNVSSSDFIIGEQISLSGFQNDPNNNNLNGTYYLTDTKINGGDLYHEIQCNPPPATTTTTTIIPPSPKPPERQTIDAFLKLYYSGGGANNDPLKSLGGNISNFIIKSSKNNIFENVSGDIYEEGLTDYRCVYVKNNSLNRIFYLYFALDDFFLGSIQNLGFNFVNEVQTVTVLNGPFVNGQTLVFSYEGKNFTVVYDTNFAQWLLNFNSAIKQVASLEDVVVTGNSNGSNAIFEITFEGTAGYKNHPLIVLVGYNLSPTPSVSILKSISGSPINSIAEKIAATTNEPNNITFYDATVNSPVYLPILNPGDFLPIWLRRIVYPNTIAVENDGCKLIISGNYEVIEE